MKKIIYNLTYSLVFALALTGCERDEFLPDGTVTDGSITNEQVWANNDYTRGILANAYASVTEGYNLDGNGALLASGSDEAVNSNQNSIINALNNGTWSPVRTVDDVYSEM